MLSLFSLKSLIQGGGPLKFYRNMLRNSSLGIIVFTDCESQASPVGASRFCSREGLQLSNRFRVQGFRVLGFRV